MDELECHVQRLIGDLDKTEDKSEKANPSETSRLFEMIQAEEKEWCEVFADVARDTKELAQVALETNVAPSEGFLFYA
ncbi:MAG: hypothetical protein FJ247_08285, partial [Nitrospira sp.]|nr:hypothetical protein [Nitrospira sp.]